MGEANLPSQHDMLVAIMPTVKSANFGVFYMDSHTIEVRFYRNNKREVIKFDVLDWMSDACLARLAMELP